MHVNQPIFRPDESTDWLSVISYICCGNNDFENIHETYENRLPLLDILSRAFFSEIKRTACTIRFHMNKNVCVCGVVKSYVNVYNILFKREKFKLKWYLIFVLCILYKYASMKYLINFSRMKMFNIVYY